MRGRKHRYNKNINSNIIQKENDTYEIKRKKKYISLWDLFESIIKQIYYIIIVIILKIYYSMKIDEFSDKDYISFFAIDCVLAGGPIYFLTNLLIKFYELYSPFNQEWSYLYIWIICSLQILFFFTSLFLFLMKYIYIKLFFIEKFKILFKILCVVIIIFNFLSLKDLNHDKYYFQIQNFEVKKLSHYKKYFQKHYVNLYLSKDYDVSEYELCFEMLYPDNFSLIFKKELTYSPWEFTRKKDYFIGCRNVSFKDNPSINKNQSLTFFKCDINEKNNVNILPNYCISAKERRKKYDFIYKLNIYEFILLILCYIYGYLTRYLFYRHHLFLNGKYADNDNNEEGEECEESEEKDDDMIECEEVDDEGEEEEDDEEEEEEEEEKYEENNWRRNKYRKISKKKMKYYKKKQKNRYRKYYNNTNEEKDEENEQEKNENEIKSEETKENINDKKNNLNDDKLIEENKNELKESNDKEKTEKKDNESEYIIEKNKKEEIKKINKEEQENDKKESHIDNNDNNERRTFRRNNFIYDLVLGGIVDKIKTKFYNILKEIDKDIIEDEKNKEN